MATVAGGNFPGTAGKDFISGTAGDDVIHGFKGNDRLKGVGGDDTIFGGQGRDRINGGTGDDVMTGDRAHHETFKDVFVFHENSGKDVITDFDVDRDVLEISKGLNGINTAKDVLKHASQHGDDVIINLGDGNKITLKGVDLDDLKKHPGDHFDIV